MHLILCFFSEVYKKKNLKKKKRLLLYYYLKVGRNIDSCNLFLKFANSQPCHFVAQVHTQISKRRECGQVLETFVGDFDTAPQIQMLERQECGQVSKTVVSDLLAETKI